MGLDNRWDFWIRDDKAGVISLRGTTAKLTSWLANFYAAMVAATGVREFIIMGHSQGETLAFLLRSHLHYLTQKGELPKDIVYKTYCSAALKPVSLYYAYDYDFLTRNGWGFTIVNTLDWVPETPFTVQRISDFNPSNPFVNVKGGLCCWCAGTPRTSSTRWTASPEWRRNGFRNTTAIWCIRR